MRQYVKTPAGSKAIKSLRSAVESSPVYSAYLEEVRGMAEGANITLDDAFLMQCGDELENLMKVHVPHCSDIVNPEIGAGGLLAHNEDAGVSSFDWRTGAPLTYMVSAEVEDTSVASTDASGYTALCYPGQLPTGAFGFNTRGVFFSLNGLFPEHVNITGIPRHFVHRHLLTSPSIDALVSRLQETDVACGFSINVASVTEPGRMLNIEVATGRQWSIIELQRGKLAKEITNTCSAAAAGAGEVCAGSPLPVGAGPQPWPFPFPDGSKGSDPASTNYNFHFNEYVRLPTAQFPDPSSFARATAASALPAPASEDAAKHVLGNKSNGTYPLWRNGAPPDGIATICTALFHVSVNETAASGEGAVASGTGAGRGRVDIYVRNPLSEEHPVASFAVVDSEGQ